MAGSLGIYIHIPFCRSKCDYCDFYSLAGGEGRMDAYQKALMMHIRETAQLARGWQVDSIYFGGGTPSYFGEKRLRELLAVVRRRFRVAKNAEITMEANPDSLDKKSAHRLRRAGFNRLSLGMQSACDRQLVSLHRPHDFSQVTGAVAAGRAAKFDNLSLDLIYGLPGQDLASWQDTLEKALALNPEHISCYGLKVEEGTPLAGRVARGEALPDDDQQAEMYLWAVDRLAAAGYTQYEVSNFAKPGRESRHNLKYWMSREYIGFGPGAHSDFGGRRYSFVRDLEGYITGVLEGRDLVAESDLIPRRERSGEYLMLRLRTARGIEEWEYRREYLMNFDPIEARLNQYEHNGWATRCSSRWRLTPKGFLLSNRLIGELLECQEEAELQNVLSKVRSHRLTQTDQEDQKG
ncbi:Oxygen-independent coproporphyrinogen-III oxidase-like protein YqeR [bioreactor metagenome]|uniref:Oxygen-independent coproporphyrinogen-III oxidase-like protein YqeR n=1 Tax=bioreactor metagenome TaxID=1076179 RepID=A0A645CPZ3_9ZZZZ